MAADMILRPATAADMGAVARIHRVAFNAALPHLADRHTPEEDLAFFSAKVFPRTTMWLGEADIGPVGFIAFRPTWIDHLYVEPGAQRRGLGAALLRVAMQHAETLRLWTFQCNSGARRFYEGHGFELDSLTDGARNEEREPDALYRWRAKDATDVGKGHE